MVLDPKQQNFTHLISFEEALEKVLDRFNQILNNLPEYDGIVLLCHEEESMAYLLKAVKKSGLYEKFCFLVKGLGYVCQYLSGEFLYFFSDDPYIKGSITYILPNRRTSGYILPREILRRLSQRTSAP